jgi:hypothetical protein
MVGPISPLTFNLQLKPWAFKPVATIVALILSTILALLSKELSTFIQIHIDRFFNRN